MDSPEISPVPPVVSSQGELPVKPGPRAGAIHSEEISEYGKSLAACLIFENAIKAGKTPDEAFNLVADAAKAALDAEEATSGGSETDDTDDAQEKAQDDPPEDEDSLTQEEVDTIRFEHWKKDAYITACLDIAHGHFETLDTDRKERAACAIANKVVPFEEWCKRCGL